MAHDHHAPSSAARDRRHHARCRGRGCGGGGDRWHCRRRTKRGDLERGEAGDGHLDHRNRDRCGHRPRECALDRADERRPVGHRQRDQPEHGEPVPLATGAEAVEPDRHSPEGGPFSCYRRSEATAHAFSPSSTFVYPRPISRLVSSRLYTTARGPSPHIHPGHSLSKLCGRGQLTHLYGHVSRKVPFGAWIARSERTMLVRSYRFRMVQAQGSGLTGCRATPS